MDSIEFLLSRVRPGLIGGLTSLRADLEFKNKSNHHLFFSVCIPSLYPIRSAGWRFLPAGQNVRYTFRVPWSGTAAMYVYARTEGAEFTLSEHNGPKFWVALPSSNELRHEMSLRTTFMIREAIGSSPEIEDAGVSSNVELMQEVVGVMCESPEHGPFLITLE